MDSKTRVVYRSLHFRVLRNEAVSGAPIYWMQYRRHFWNKWGFVMIGGYTKYSLASLAECLVFKDVKFW